MSKDYEVLEASAVLAVLEAHHLDRLVTVAVVAPLAHLAGLGGVGIGLGYLAMVSDLAHRCGERHIREGRQIYPNTGGKTITTIAAHAA
jgi:hypothetical protein